MVKHLSIYLISLLLLSVSICSNVSGQESMTVVVDRALKNAQSQSLLMARLYADNPEALPRSFEKGKNTFSDSYWWTSGFFPGLLWYLYEDSRDAEVLKYAKDYTARVEKEKYSTTNHDIGFMLYCSFGNGLRIASEPGYEQVLMTGANSLSKRYKEHIGLIRSWDHNKANWQYPVIIDNMMNLELLMWAADKSGDKHLRKVAISHADNTLKHHYRADNSCYHVVSYDTISGKPHIKQTAQGYADETAWARGQAWGLYGFTMMYRMTDKQEYLQQARKVASFLINHPRMPKNMVPYWDFDAPNIQNEPLDSSTAAIMASALIELSGFVDKKEAKSYLAVAQKQIRSLASDEFTAPKGENGNFILKHGTGNYPAHSEIDAPLTYGDYYYVEALMRWKKLGVK